jgi:phage terminase large subunit-like protein
VEWSPEWERYTRRYRELYLSTAKKNGKSELVAGLTLYLLTDGEEGAEVYGLARDKDQAALIFDVAARMVELSPVLSRNLELFKGKDTRRIVYRPTASFYAVAAGDALGNLGPNPYAAYIDELLAQPGRDLYDALHGGFGTRAEPLLMLVTTADNDPVGFAAAEREWSEKVAADPGLDRARLAVVKAIPRDLDVFDEANWHLSNPGLGDYVDPRVLRDEAAKAKANPAAERAFRQFRANQQSRKAGKAVDLDAWDASAGPVPFTAMAEALAGARCYGGMDLASTIDTAAYALDFPEAGGAHAVLWRVFAPEAGLDALDRRTGGQATVWAERGWLTLTSGNVIDYEAIKAALRLDAEVFDIAAIGYDRWGATQLSAELVEEGFPVVQVGQGFASMSGPTKELMRLVTAGQYHHGGNPVARWQAGDLIIRTDPSGNWKPDKSQRRQEKIDAMVAAVMALGRALATAPARPDYAAAGF